MTLFLAERHASLVPVLALGARRVDTIDGIDGVAGTPAVAAAPLQALLLEAPQLLLDPIDGAIDGGARPGGQLAAHDIVTAHLEGDLRGMPVLLGGHGDVGLLDVVHEALELLEALFGEETILGIQFTVSYGQEYAHGLPLGRRARSRPGMRQATRRRQRAGRILSCSRYFATVRRAILSPRSCSSSAMR